MLLAIDIGNTQSVFALCDKHGIKTQWRLSTDKHRSADEYAILCKEALSFHNYKLSDIESVILSSVVPPIEYSIRCFSKQYLSLDIVIIGRKKNIVPIQIGIDNPAEIGADRLVNSYAAITSYGKDCIVIDFGTATTFDVAKQEGVYLGGVIAPGIQLSLEALELNTARLPHIAIKRTERVTGRNTVEAMQSGIYHGYSALVEGLVARLKSEHGSNFIVIATGGLAPLIADGTKCIDHVDEFLMLHGLRRLAYRKDSSPDAKN